MTFLLVVVVVIIVKLVVVVLFKYSSLGLNSTLHTVVISSLSLVPKAVHPLRRLEARKLVSRQAGGVSKLDKNNIYP